MLQVTVSHAWAADMGSQHTGPVTVLVSLLGIDWCAPGQEPLKKYCSCLRRSVMFVLSTGISSTVL